MQDTDVILHDLVLVRKFVELGFGFGEELIVDGAFLLVELEKTQFVLAGRQREDLLSVFGFGFLGSTERDTLHDRLETRDTERLTILHRRTNELSPDALVVKGTEPKELDESVDIVEFVLDGSSSEAETSIRDEIATSPTSDRANLLNRTI